MCSTYDGAPSVAPVGHFDGMMRAGEHGGVADQQRSTSL
jgi:hypothetical protein